MPGRVFDTFPVMQNVVQCSVCHLSTVNPVIDRMEYEHKSLQQESFDQFLTNPNQCRTRNKPSADRFMAVDKE